MIAWLDGVVRERNPTAGVVVLQVGGVGYEVNVSIQTLADIPEVGEAIALHVHTHVREDQLSLYGFVDLRERALYRMLTSVPKVGPKNALAVLGGLPLGELVACIAGREHTRLLKIPGIGKKTAEQISLTLGDKMAGLAQSMGDAGEGPERPSGSAELDAARDVLISLGWKNKVVEKALATLDSDSVRLGLDELVRLVLARLMER